MPQSNPPRTRVLFMAEAVTLAHVARPAVLARSLDAARYDVHFASAHRFLSLLGDLPVPVRALHSITQQEFAAALAHGRPFHDADTLRRYVKDDLSLLREIQPHAVVGDLRMSLGISARLAGVPYLSLINAYWSPWARQRFPVPSVPAVRLLGVPVANALFQLVRPFAFASHCRHINTVRREHRLPPVGKNLLRTYTDADYVLYPDAPELVPIDGLPSSHRYIGPVLWSPAVDLPSWWNEVPQDRPILYVTLGSSGSAAILRTVIEALADEPVSLLVATAGGDPGRLPPNVWAADYLPGSLAAERSRAVIANGGSPTAYQALAAGKPVLGLPANMDQHVNMTWVTHSGAGVNLRSEQVSHGSVRNAVGRLLEEPAFTAAAQRLRDAFARYDAPALFRAALDEAVAGSRA